LCSVIGTRPSISLFDLPVFNTTRIRTVYHLPLFPVSSQLRQLLITTFFPSPKSSALCAVNLELLLLGVFCGFPRQLSFFLIDYAHLTHRPVRFALLFAFHFLTSSCHLLILLIRGRIAVVQDFCCVTQNTYPAPSTFRRGEIPRYADSRCQRVKYHHLSTW
jgi:hypothetical protein